MEPLTLFLFVCRDPTLDGLRPSAEMLSAFRILWFSTVLKQEGAN